jgi:hypothetical protein
MKEPDVFKDVVSRVRGLLDAAGFGIRVQRFHAMVDAVRAAHDLLQNDGAGFGRVYDAMKALGARVKLYRALTELGFNVAVEPKLKELIDRGEFDKIGAEP